MSTLKNCAGPPEDMPARIADALRGLRFGSVEIQVHDSRVVRITRTEKILIEPSSRNESRK